MIFSLLLPDIKLSEIQKKEEGRRVIRYLNLMFI